MPTINLGPCACCGGIEVCGCEDALPRTFTAYVINFGEGPFGDPFDITYQGQVGDCEDVPMPGVEKHTWSGTSPDGQIYYEWSVVKFCPTDCTYEAFVGFPLSSNPGPWTSNTAGIDCETMIGGSFHTTSGPNVTVEISPGS